MSEFPKTVWLTTRSRTIKPFTAIRETAHYYTLKIEVGYGDSRRFVERREEKVTEYDVYHESFDDAKSHLVNYCKNKISLYSAVINDLQFELERINALEKPNE